MKGRTGDKGAAGDEVAITDRLVRCRADESASCHMQGSLLTAPSSAR